MDRYARSTSFSGWPSAKSAVPPTWPVSVPAVAYPAASAAASAGYGMVPAQPPLPTASNLPFQPDAGSQISTLMSESLVGISVAVTRQNAGRVAYGLAPPPRPGCTNAPAPAATL